MAAAADPISAIADALGDMYSAVGDVASGWINYKTVKIQSAAQKYIAGQITEQEYIKLQAQEEGTLSDTVNNILADQQKTSYIPYLLIGGILLVIIISITKRKIA